MNTDLPLAELIEYRSAQQAPDDFDEFWNRTLAESRAFELDLTLSEVLHPSLREIRTFDVTFNGFHGQPVKAWLRIPAAATEPMPAVVQYVGYGGGRGHAFESLLWAAAGYAHLQMDNRGQGSAWSVGHTADPTGSGPQIPGFMTRGIHDPETYYYRRLITDAVRAIDAAGAITAIDGTQIALLGGSQGAGLALAAAVLTPGIRAIFARVPFLCDFPRAITITDRAPYYEITQYLAVHRHEADRVFRTLSYFDGVNFASRAQAPAWFSVGLMDPTSPPSTVFAAFNAYAGVKDIAVWPHNAHEGGGIEDDMMTLDVLAGLFPATPASR
ncbi:MAG TPA: acetylxylan esterase [Pseudolysinimonas sp.]|nr:acetylxylan esterase [Pseudolysinimonas sp.]